MEELIKNLYPMNRCLLGEGYDSALEYIKMLIGLDVIEIPSGTKLETWTVPDEWIVRDAWLKLNGEKILDYTKQPLSLVVGSLPFKGMVKIEELKEHINTDVDNPDAQPYSYKFYDKDWGFAMPHHQAMLLAEGDYEVFIDTEYRPGTMKLGVHTIKGESDREILLFAHLDHPFQANDNLSGVACLVDLAKRIKANHTIKIILCPETIGSIAYAKTQDISKVDFVIAVDICGNTNSILFQKSFNREDKINKVANLALRQYGDFRAGDFRSTIGSDEYFFNDPDVGIQGILFTTFPYDQYHTAADIPEKIDYEQIKKVQDVILKTIEYYEADFVPQRSFKGPLMRSKYDLQLNDKRQNLLLDYFFYFINGKRSVAELCVQYGMDFSTMIEALNKLEKDGQISRVDAGEGKVDKAPRKKHKKISRKANVPVESGEGA
jgi:aminopeptidase-like protein